jgi:uridylate kinase
MDNSLPLVVFSIKEPGNLRRIICGEDIGTLIVRE